MRALGVSFLVIASALLACQSKEGGAREQFSKDFTCPEDRVEVRARPEIKASDLSPPRREPPADIKADPGRLKMWEADQEKSRTSRDSLCDFYEARGCGQQTLFCCRRPPKHANRVWCSTERYANGVARW